MWNAELDEAQAAINIAMKNINNRRYGNDNTLMTQRKAMPKNGQTTTQLHSSQSAI